MPIAAGGILVAATATTRCLSSVAGMLRFLARLSGRRRHVRRFKSSAPPTSPPPLPAAAPASTTSSGSSGPGGGGGGGGGAAFASSAAGQPQTPVAMEREQQLLGQQQERRRSRSKEDDNPSEDRPLAVHYCARCRCQYCSCAFLGLDDNVVDHDDDNDHDDDDGDVDEGRRHRPYLYGEGESENDGRKQRYREGGTSWLQHKDGRDSSTTSTESCTDRDVLRRRPPEIQRERTIPSTTSVGCARSGLGAIIPPYLATLLILSYSIIGMADACSSRSTPKPRPPTPTPRPNITFHMYTCPTYYAEWYCLNGATCFTVKIVDSLLYNCLCANGYIGQRCEFKDLDGSYLPSRQRVMLETASIAGAVTIAVFLIVIAFISVYIHCKRKQKELRTSSVDAVDGPGRDPELRPFCSRSRSLMTFMAKNPNSSTMPSIEQTRMPNWNYSAESSTRMASVNENKRSSQ